MEAEQCFVEYLGGKKIAFKDLNEEISHCPYSKMMHFWGQFIGLSSNTVFQKRCITGTALLKLMPLQCAVVEEFFEMRFSR